MGNIVSDGNRRGCILCGNKLSATRGRCKTCSATNSLTGVIYKIHAEFSRVGFNVDSVDYLRHSKQSISYLRNDKETVMGMLRVMFGRSYAIDVASYKLPDCMNVTLRGSNTHVLPAGTPCVTGFVSPIRILPEDDLEEVEKKIKSTGNKILRWLSMIQDTGVTSVWKLKGVL